jgi:hypothetical protein
LVQETFDSQNQPQQRQPRFKTITQILQDTVRQPNYPPHVLFDAYLATIGESMYEPQTLQKAMNSPKAHHWDEAMKYELQALYDNKTWTLVPLPKGRQHVCNK